MIHLIHPRSLPNATLSAPNHAGKPGAPNGRWLQRGAMHWPMVVTLLHAIPAVRARETQHTRCARLGDGDCSVNDWKRAGATAASAARHRQSDGTSDLDRAPVAAGFALRKADPAGDCLARLAMHRWSHRSRRDADGW